VATHPDLNIRSLGISGAQHAPLQASHGLKDVANAISALGHVQVLKELGLSQDPFTAWQVNKRLFSQASPCPEGRCQCFLSSWPRPGAPGREQSETPQAPFGACHSAHAAAIVRRGGECVGSIPAADEGGGLVLVELAESPLDSPCDGRRKPPPIVLEQLVMLPIVLVGIQ
jgi:hypothetical protein